MEIKNLTEVFGTQVVAGLGGAQQMDSCFWYSCWPSFSCDPDFACMEAFSCGGYMAGEFFCMSYYCAPPPDICP